MIRKILCNYKYLIFSINTISPRIHQIVKTNTCYTKIYSKEITLLINNYSQIQTSVM